MERAFVWFKCAAVHDPVRPVLKAPAVIGWQAKQRRVDLTIERGFTGQELLRRMNGWVTVDVVTAIDIIGRHGRLKVLDEGDLVVETPDAAAMERLSADLAQAFGAEAWIETVSKTNRF